MALQENDVGLQSSRARRQTLTGIKQFFLRRYWTRVWIVQECLLNDVLILVCGAMMNEFDELFDAANNLAAARIGSSSAIDTENPLSDGQDGNAASTSLTQIGAGRRSLKANQKQSLIAWMATFATSDCQESRDTFYGFRALASAGNSFNVVYISNTVDLLLHTLSIHNWSHFTSWVERNAILQDQGTRSTEATASQTASWWSCPVPTNVGPSSKGMRGLLYDGLKDFSYPVIRSCRAWFIVPQTGLYYRPSCTTRQTL